jgi:4-amino-4-deoxy-L-arabinose transferase-like glycosyltransferase
VTSLPKPAAPWLRDLLLLTLAFGLLLAFRLGAYPLANPDEARYAEIPREMVASGDWVTPRLDGVVYFEKPPLVYWVTAASLTLFGPDETAMRAGPALFALLGVLATYAAARRLHGRTAGLVAATVLATSTLYFALGRILILDMAVSVLMSTALFCFILGVREAPGARRRWLFYGLYASMALATLAKGLIGFLVTGAVMFTWLLLFNQWHRLRPLYLPTGAALFLALAAPWHLLAALHNETWAHRYFVYEHWLRFTTAAADRPGPWWYFIPVVLLGVFPWTGFLWPAWRDALRGGWAARKEKADQWFFATWVGFVFLFFSASHSKLVPYVLPVFPALAVMTGAWLAREMERDDARLRGGIGVFSLVCGVLAIGLIGVFQTDVIRHEEQAAALWPYACALAALLLAGGIAAPWITKTHRPRAALAVVGATAVLFFGTLALAAPYLQRVGTTELAAIVRAQARPGDRIVHFHDFFHDFTFYTGRLVDVADGRTELELEEDAAARASGRFYDLDEFRRHWAGPERVWVVLRQRDLPELTADPAFRYHLLGQTRIHYLLSNRP